VQVRLERQRNRCIAAGREILPSCRASSSSSANTLHEDENDRKSVTAARVRQDWRLHSSVVAQYGIMTEVLFLSFVGRHAFRGGLLSVWKRASRCPIWCCYTSQ